MTTFDKREEAFETRFVHDQELEFKAHARRDRKLGLWAAHQLGKEGAEAEDYAQALIGSEITGGGSDGVMRKLLDDLSAGGVAQAEDQVRRMMDEFLTEARQEVRSA